MKRPPTPKPSRDFVRLHDRVYQYRAARWPSAHRRQLSVLSGEPPYDARLEIQCFVARDRGTIAARAAAIIDQHYLAHWNEPLGHLMMFEAMPHTSDAVRKMMLDAACESGCVSRGMQAARAGATTALLDAPFAIDEYEMLPPSILRQNPGYYHSVLKDAGFGNRARAGSIKAKSK